jgi:plastocyanin
VLRKHLLIGITVVALLGAACGGDDNGGSTDAATEDTGGGGGGSVTLTAADIAFDPTDLSAAAGDTIEFVNEDDTEHNFTAEDAGINEDVDPSSSTTIDLTDVKPGTYDFLCEYHPDDMTGTLEVT